MVRSISESRKEAQSLRNRIRRSIMTIITSLPFIGLRIRRQLLRASADQVRDQFAPRIREAQARGDQAEYESLRHDAFHEQSEYWDALRGIETDDLLRRARRQLISVPPRDWIELDDDGNFHETHWEMGNFGDVFLKHEVYDDLAKKVRDAERETGKYQSALVNAATGVAGLLLSVIALIFTFVNLHSAQTGINRMEQRIAAQEKQASEMRGVVSGLRREQSNIELALIRVNPPAPARTTPPAARKEGDMKRTSR